MAEITTTCEAAELTSKQKWALGQVHRLILFWARETPDSGQSNLIKVITEVLAVENITPAKSPSQAV